MNPIGGFFELEIPRKKTSLPWEGAIGITSGRAALLFLLKKLRPKKIYVPYYICDSMIRTIEKMPLEIEFYAIDPQLDPLIEPSIKKNELFLYVNYFGVKTRTAKRLGRQFGSQLILDNTHAFFAGRILQSHSFNSARKFFGVPDGGFVFTKFRCKKPQRRNNTVFTNHLIEKYLGLNKQAYDHYKRAELNVSSKPLGMSLLSERILNGLELKFYKQIRRDNFSRIHRSIGYLNRLEIALEQGDAPLCYPFLSPKGIEPLDFHKEDIFIPRYWDDVLNRSSQKSDYQTERLFSSRLIAIPIDQRCDPADCYRIVKFIRNHLSEESHGGRLS